MRTSATRTRYGERPGARPRPGRAGLPGGERPGPAGRLRGDRGQAAFEFTGMIPIILGTLVLLWQAALVGYTFSLAGNAADEAARAAAVGAACGEAATADLPAAWNADVDCPGAAGDLVTADVALETPVLFPGFTIPVTITGHGAALREIDP